MKCGRYEIRNSYVKNSTVKQYWWVYIAKNGEIVCQSEMLTSEAAARKGIRSVKRGVFAPVKVAS